MKLPRISRSIAPTWTPPADGGWPPRPQLRIQSRAALAIAGYLVLLWLVPRYLAGWQLPAGGRAAGLVAEGLLRLGPLVLIFWLLLRADRRLKRRVRARDGAVCTRCGYDLGASAPEGVCPECGRPYSVRQLRWRWRGARILPMPTRDETLREAMTDAGVRPSDPPDS